MCQALFSQKIEADFRIVTDLVEQTNLQSIKNLEKSVNDFLNFNNWIEETVGFDYSISISILLTIKDIDNGNYNSNLQIQSGRPIYNSSYLSPLTNFYDQNVNFEFVSFQFLGGSKFFEKAKIIADTAQSNGISGWEFSRNNNRYNIIEELSSNTFLPFRRLIYNYHRRGMDEMVQNPSGSKEIIFKNILLLKPVLQTQPNSMLVRSFFDAKAEEISQIFASGPDINTQDLKSFLNSFYPNLSNYWKIIN